ncbi:MAG: hypothetical protein JWM91_790 [Rhodospirillales bacterium]|nr:hypothetical protein [Rhodospirillales bacterium]
MKPRMMSQHNAVHVSRHMDVSKKNMNAGCFKFQDRYSILSVDGRKYIKALIHKRLRNYLTNDRLVFNDNNND